MNYAAVRCPACGYRTHRKIREDMLRDDRAGRYGLCVRCPTPLARSAARLIKRCEKAKADLRGMGLEAY